MVKHKDPSDGAQLSKKDQDINQEALQTQSKSGSTQASNNSSRAASNMWGGRFEGGVDVLMEQINASIGFDQRLAAQDIAGSKAHVKMLVAQKIVSETDGTAILDGLAKIEAEIAAGQFEFQTSLEDIHMNIESRLRELIGGAAGRLHTARSRNDQVATDFKMWVRDEIDRIHGYLVDLQKAFLALASQHVDSVMPGFTHLQTAQPVTFGHHCLAYVEMFERDRARFADARTRLNQCPLGAAALAGTSFPIDRVQTAKALGFDAPTANSLDSVSDRDFAIETVNAAALCAIHLSRFAEELVVWSSAPFGFVQMSDSFSTGSSIMPQKRNPDAAELVRAKTGRIFGAQTTLQTVMKGLPLAYSKDMQEDKEPVFDALDSLEICLLAMAGMVKDLKVKTEKMRAASSAGFSTATDLADWLVRVLNKPFREAHEITGKLVALAEKKGCDLTDLSLTDVQKVDAAITDAVFDVLSVNASVESRTSYGGTAPDNVKSQISGWLTKLGSMKEGV